MYIYRFDYLLRRLRRICQFYDEVYQLLLITLPRFGVVTREYTLEHLDMCWFY